MDSANSLTMGMLLISGVVILSYMADLFAHKIRLPSVLVLLSLGMLIRGAMLATKTPLPDLASTLPFLGTVGLILIVLEASLHLELDQKALRLMGKALLGALTVLIGASMAIAGFLYLLFGESFQACLVNAIPFAVISSAMAIPTAKRLQGASREFIVFESTFSDILGILFFTMASSGHGGLAGWALGLGSNLVVTLFLSALISVGLVWLITQLNHHVKFFLILFLLLMAYSLAKLFHLPALLMVFLFGLCLGNAHLLHLWPALRRHIDSRRVKVELRYTQVATAESAFLVRTFFFVLFGYSLDMDLLMNREAWEVALSVLCLSFALRWLYLKYKEPSHVFPETWLYPRGLITVLLFSSIPPAFALQGVSTGAIFLVVVLSAAIMAVGMGEKPRL